MLDARRYILIFSTNGQYVFVIQLLVKGLLRYVFTDEFIFHGLKFVILFYATCTRMFVFAFNLGFNDHPKQASKLWPRVYYVNSEDCQLYVNVM